MMRSFMALTRASRCDSRTLITILANHCAEFINSPNTRPGILQDNPIHKDMLYAARTAGLRFIVNVILNGEREIIASFSGGLEEAHAEGCRFLTSLASVNKVPCDITVVTNGGYPLDQNIYQAVKGLTSAEAANKVGTVLAVRAFTTTWRNAKRRRSFWNAFRTSTADTPFPTSGSPKYSRAF